MGHFDNGTYSSEFKTHSIFSTGDTSSEVLDRLCFSARDESPLKAVENLTIGLPPKQLVLMVLPQFFAQVDYQTDIFVQTHLLAEIERIYSRSAIVATDAWAICFNTIILLVIGPEGWTHGHGPPMVSQFTQPLFQAMRAALNQAHLLTIPKLINVQALALLSIAAEKYYSAATSTAIFAQACLLGRRTGLHQARNTTGDVSQDESIERYKTFVSLHLRDKSQCLSISSICWLPSFDHGSHLETIPFMFADARIAQRVQLADIQEQLYRCISTEPRQQPQRSSSDLLSICRELESWSNGQDGQESSAHPFQSIHEAEYQLTFLATRMLAFSRSPDSVHGQAMLADARASCLILLISCEKHDQGMIRMLQSLGRLARIPTQSASPPKHKSVDSRNTSSLSTGSFMFMANAFPAISVFQMAKRIFLSQDQNETKSSDAATISDFELLQNVYDCMVRANSQGQCQNRSKQMERTLECLLELIQVKKRGPLSPSPTYDITIPSPQVETPHTSAALGFGLGGFPVNAATIPRTTNVPWDFMTSPVSDVMICVGAEAHPEDMEPRKKRPRTSETEFCVDRDLGLLDGGWGEPAILL
ncbi:hypothetical protein E8E14_013088 [Neopestalotiopsis sp. 37M]|nr:hypothetical protein E8E14_013088 [Neopestalotiopsis sp. 37M]